MKKYLLPLVALLLLTGCTSQNKELTSDINHYQEEIDKLNARLEEYQNVIEEQSKSIEDTQRMLDSLNQAVEQKESPILMGEFAKDQLSGVDQKVIEALSTKDMKTLSTLVHPVYGVRFTPYSYVDNQTDIVMTAFDLTSDDYKSTSRIWGIYDGSGTPIDLTFDEYYKNFVYSSDFKISEDITYNEPHSTGNMYDNHQGFYPQSIAVDYHFDGFDEKYQGMDWKTLRLVFQKYDGEWYLVGIIHNQWTI